MELRYGLSKYCIDVRFPELHNCIMILKEIYTKILLEINSKDIDKTNMSK